MGYNLKKLTKELQEKGLSDDGLVAYGQRSSGALTSLLLPMYAISKVGNNILIIPFTNKRIEDENKKEINSSDIVEAKVSGLLIGKLKIKTTKGNVVFPILQGKGSVKQILLKLGF